MNLFKHIIRSILTAALILMLPAMTLRGESTQLSLWNFQDTTNPSGIALNMSATAVIISTGSILFQNGTDDGGTRIGYSGTWPTGDFNPSGKHLEFSVQPNNGFGIDYISISLRFGRTQFGPTRVTVQYSTDGFDTPGTTVLDNAVVSSENADNLDAFTIDANLPAGELTETLTIRIWGHNASGTGNLRFNNFRVFGSVVAVSAGALLSATPGTLEGFMYAEGNGPTGGDSFVLTGYEMDDSDVVVTAPAGFEVSAGESSAYASSVTLSSWDGSPQSLWVRMAAGLSVDNYSGSLNISGGGADTITVNLSGEVIEAFSIPYVNSFRSVDSYNRAIVQGFTATADDVQETADPYLRIGSGQYVETPETDLSGYDFMLYSFSARTHGGDLGQILSLKITTGNGQAYETLHEFELTGAFDEYEFEINLVELELPEEGRLRIEMTAGGGSSRFRDLSIDGTPRVGEPSEAVSGFYAVTTAHNRIIVAWEDSDAANYLVKGSTEGFEAIVPPVNDEEEEDGLLVQNVARGHQSHAFTGLTPSQTYYFKVFPYNAIENIINYKTDEAVPSVSRNTLGPPVYSWTGADQAAWTEASNWEPARSETEAYDIISFDDGSAKTVTGIPTETLGGLMVSDGTSVTLQAEATTTLSITGALEVQTGASLHYDPMAPGGTLALTGTEQQSIGGGGMITAGSHATLRISNSAGVLLNTDANVHHLTIDEHASLAIAPGRHLDAGGTLTNNAGASGLILQSSPDGTASLIHESEAVEATVQRYIPGTADWSDSGLGWHMLSSPVAEQAIEGFTTAPAGDFDFYSWDEGGGFWANIDNGSLGDTHFTPGKGYLVAYKDPQHFSFTGVLNTGNTDSPLMTHTPEGSSFPGVNMLGNPYPSSIDWSLANTGQFAEIYAHVYDEHRDGGPGYVSIGGAAGNGGVEGSGGRLIAPHQGFFVFVTEEADGERFSFTNELRNHGGTFLKDEAGQPGSRLRLRFGNDSHYDEALIVIHPGSDAGRDRWDAQKLFSFAHYVPELYTLTADQVAVSINAMPGIDESLSIPIGLKVPADGSYYLMASEISGRFDELPLFLVDRQEGVAVPLSREDSHVFFAGPGDDAHRFDLRFGDSTTGPDDEPGEATETTAWVHQGVLHVSGISGPARLELYDLSGRLLQSFRTTGERHHHPVSLPAGLYLLRIHGHEWVEAVKVAVE